MSLLRAALMRDETGRLSRCLVPHNEAAHRARRQTEGFRRGIDECGRRTIAVHRMADDGFAVLCCRPVNSSGRAETFKALIEVGNRIPRLAIPAVTPSRDALSS